jgi:poly-gamma-glutamate synthesis protein (capsule biosynthesis protein)
MKTFPLSFFFAALVSGAATFAQGAASPPATPALSEKAITFALAGDIIANRRLSAFNAPGYAPLIELVRHADVAFANLETLIHDFDIPGAAESGGAWMGSPAWLPEEIKWAGFDLLSVANNHAFDFGVEGLRSTTRALKKSGLTFAGTGENLALARSPAYLDTVKGRVALIACASTFTDGSLAGVQRIDLPGRPGLNPLRVNTTYTVDATTFAGLQHFSGGRGGEGGGRGGEGGGGGGRGAGGGGRLRLLGSTFVKGEGFSVKTEPNATDLKEITASVRDGRQQADWVVVSIHSHESPPGSRQKPADFLVIFAHAAIDAGADIVVAHGPHVVRGVEVYHSKPIFYSLANFYFENETMLFQPTESYEQLGLPPTALPGDFFTTRSANDTKGFPADEKIWESFLAEVDFNTKSELTAIRLHPVLLGYKLPRTKRGRPYLADETKSRAIVDELNELSKPYGTAFTYENGVGTWQASAKPAAAQP